jgi:hypothetical protein
MPAPPDPAAEDQQDDDLELSNALRAATEAADSMNNEAYFGSAPPELSSEPAPDTKPSAPSLPSLTVATASLPPPPSTPPAARAATTGASPLKTAAASATLRLDHADGARKSKSVRQASVSKKKARTWIMVTLVIMALVAVGLMLWSQQANRAASKARAKPAGLPSSTGSDLKR